MYDLLGLFSPVTSRGKLFLQDLWNKRFSWDEHLPAEEQAQWTLINKDLKVLETCKFPKHIGLSQTHDIMYRLIGFSDASKRAYATVLYLLQTSRSGCKAYIVFSKVRLAPTKEITIPRLELLGALISTRCMEFVSSQLHLPIFQKYLWVDSQCVLSWIRSTKLLTSFVENRVKEIRGHQDIIFNYIPSKENPADIASRGISMDDLLNNQLWWVGPNWLIQSSETWPVWNCTLMEETEKHIQSEYKKLSQHCESNLVVGEDALRGLKRDTFEMNAPFSIDIKRFSSVTRLLRVTSLASRFVSILRKRKKI